MATRYTSLGTAALIAGSIGASVYTASTAQSAREAISAAHDPTTAHGDLIVRVDAGGADVTALARLSASGAPDGGVVSVVNGSPQWAAASAGVDPWAAIALPITGDWTLTNGGLAGASAAESSGTLLLTFPAAGTQGALAGVDYARAYQALEPGNAYAYSLIARLAQITNNAGLYGRIFVAKDTAIASNQYGLQVRGSDGAAQFYAWTTGGSTAVGSGFTLPTNGTGWVRLKLTPPGVSYYYGTGTTTDPPASWTYQGATPITDQRELPVRAGYLAGWPNGALGATGTVTWANASLTVP